MFPIYLGVTQLSGTGADSIFLGVAKAMPVRAPCAISERTTHTGSEVPHEQRPASGRGGHCRLSVLAPHTHGAPIFWHLGLLACPGHNESCTCNKVVLTAVLCMLVALWLG